MGNPILVYNGNIPLISHHDEDRNDNNAYDDYNTSNTSRTDENVYNA